jgi:hypothetical protein
MELVRYEDSSSSSSFGEKIFLKDSHVQDNFILKNYDVITIPDASEWWPVVSE